MKLKDIMKRRKTKTRGPTFVQRLAAKQQEAAAQKAALDALAPDPPTGG